MPDPDPLPPHSVASCIDTYRNAENAANATRDAAITGCGTNLQCKKNAVNSYRSTMNAALEALAECVNTASN